MYVRAIHIKKFRHLENIEIGPFSSPNESSSVVVLAGANGGGKSSILELIGFALSSTWSLSWSAVRSHEGSSFEIELGVSKDESQLIQTYLMERASPIEPGVLSAIEAGTYFRAFDFPDGKYASNPNLYNQIHRYVTDVLRIHYKRPLGFFIRSERNSATSAYNSRSLLEYDRQSASDYMWQWAFNTADAQYKDMYEFLIGERFHFYRRLGQHIANEEPGLRPVDPLQAYDELLQKLFPDYRFGQLRKEIPDNLYVELPSGETIAFRDLSSGEKEVFFICSFFLRQNVTSAVIIIDEPELHLHPELARLLVQTIQTVKPDNQIWLATHNPEIIDEAGLEQTTFIERDRQTRRAFAIKGSSEGTAIRQLKSLFGLSGYIGIGRRMVFLEGEEASADKKILETLLPRKGAGIRLIPSQSVGNMPRINQAVLAILENSLAVSDFYLVRDRDYLSDEMCERYVEKARGRICVLDRYHIENYLLVDDLLAVVLGEIYKINLRSEQIAEQLRQVCAVRSCEALRDMSVYRLSAQYQWEDLSLTGFGNGQSCLNADGSLNSDLMQSLQEKLACRATALNEQLIVRTATSAVGGLVQSCAATIQQALAPSSNDWRKLFPGRRILDAFASKHGIRDVAAFRNVLIKYLADHPALIPGELREIIYTIENGGSFGAVH